MASRAQPSGEICLNNRYDVGMTVISTAGHDDAGLVAFSLLLTAERWPPRHGVVRQLRRQNARGFDVVDLP